MTNRIIKFRVWDIENKQWCPDYFGDSKFTINQTFEDENVTFQQFTGLSDKNEKEIFEGDILKITWTKPKSNLPTFVNNPRETVKQICEVDFQNGSFNCNPCCGLHNLFYCIVKNSEIIGNIFENPELKTSSNYEIIGDAPNMYI